MKITQLIMAVCIAGAGLAGFGGIADAAPAGGTAADFCVNAVVAPELMTIDTGTEPVLTDPLPGCDVLVCAQGALSVVIDDNGVQHQACVASGAVSAPAVVAKASFVAPAAIATPASASELPRTGSGTEGLVIAALLVACGSVASLVARRKR